MDRGCRILVIDDAPQGTRLLEKVLARDGFENVKVLSAPGETLETFRSLKPDLVIVDLNMAKWDGLRLLAQLSDEMGDDFVPILALTADGSPRTKLTALASGATDFLYKPFGVDEVVARVNSLLHARLLHRAVRGHNVALEIEVGRLRAEERELEAYRDEVRIRTREAVDGDAMAMVYQPIVDLHTGAIVGAEALARFTVGDRSPASWFCEAAEIGMATEIEMAAIERALAGCATLLPPEAFLSINASARTFGSPALACALQRHPRRHFVVELTEHERVEDYRALVDAMGRRRESGARIAVDDAGSGYASLNHILEMRPDIVKLDRFLVSGIESEPVKRALVTALVRFADEVGLDLIAEGIETVEEFDAVRSLGISWGQGYYLVRPRGLPFEPRVLERLVSPA